MNHPTDWVQLGVAGAAIGALIYTVRTFIAFLGNHLAKHTQALERLTAVIERMDAASAERARQRP